MDMMNIEAVKEIHDIFTQINQQKELLSKTRELSDAYADKVNELLSVNTCDSELGEEISGQAIELAQKIEAAQKKAHIIIAKLENKLSTKYGLLSGADQAA